MNPTSLPLLVTAVLSGGVAVVPLAACPQPDSELALPTCPAAPATTFTLGSIDTGGELVVVAVEREDDLVTMQLDVLATLDAVELSYTVFDDPALPTPGAPLALAIGFIQGSGEGEAPGYWRITDAAGVLFEGGQDAQGALFSGGAAEIAGALFVDPNAPTTACIQGPTTQTFGDAAFHTEDGDVSLARDEHQVIQATGVELVAVSLGSRVVTQTFDEPCGDCPPPGTYSTSAATGFAYRKAPSQDEPP